MITYLYFLSLYIFCIYTQSTDDLGDLIRKTKFFKGCSWFKFNNLGLALVMALTFYTGVGKGLKLKVRKFGGLITTYLEVTG